MIRNKVVTNGPAFKVSGHLSLGEYFLERIRNSCDREGDKVALINGNTRDQTTYSQLLQDTVNVAVWLKSQGVKRGDVVAFDGESRNEAISGIIGAMCCGATITMFNILYTKEELQHALDISKPRVIFCTAAALEVHLDVFKATKGIEIIVQINGDPFGNGELSYKEMKGYGDPRAYEPEHVCGAMDTAAILYSSGTTGMPKGVMITHLNILYVVASLESGYTIKVSDRILTVPPWYHVFGLFTTLSFLSYHKQIVYLTGFNPDKYLSVIQEYKIHCMFVVPPILLFLGKSAIVEKYDVASVRCLWCGAAPLSRETIEAMPKRFPNFKKLIQGYGLTETTLAVLKETDELDAEPGYLPVPGCRLKVVDIETHKTLGPNEEGEICVRSPSLMKGYVNNESATNAVLDEEGYLKTGDIGCYSEKGYFSIIDRLKEIIRYKGNQVAPAAVESVILQHSSVADCGVVGRPDDMAGELPTAFVVLKPGTQLTEKELLDFTRAKLSPLSRLRGGVIFVDEIPKSAAGKILRRLLKEKLISQKINT